MCNSGTFVLRKLENKLEIIILHFSVWTWKFNLHLIYIKIVSRSNCLKFISIRYGQLFYVFRENSVVCVRMD